MKPKKHKDESICFALNGYKCEILCHTECDGCKADCSFRKTFAEYKNGLVQATEILARKGLVSVKKKNSNGSEIIGVERI